jgi:hypothetical protein
LLADLIELHLQSKQAHWNVVGKNFRDLHLRLDEPVDSRLAKRCWIDTTSRRLVIRVPPGARGLEWPAPPGGRPRGAAGPVLSRKELQRCLRTTVRTRSTW